MAALKGALIDRPAGNSITVVHLGQLDGSRSENQLHHFRVLACSPKIGIQCLDENTNRVRRDA